MSKSQIKIWINKQMMVAKIVEMDDIVWHEGEMACPHCNILQTFKAEFDIIQYGLFNADNIHTIMRCPTCDYVFALHYINTYEVTE